MNVYIWYLDSFGFYWPVLCWKWNEEKIPPPPRPPPPPPPPLKVLSLLVTFRCLELTWSWTFRFSFRTPIKWQSDPKKRRKIKPFDRPPLPPSHPGYWSNTRFVCLFKRKTSNSSFTFSCYKQDENVKDNLKWNKSFISSESVLFIINRNVLLSLISLSHVPLEKLNTAILFIYI